MTGTITRQPQGIPVGGQFAAAPHADPGVTLRPAGIGYNTAIAAWEDAETARLVLERRASRVNNLRQSHAIRALAVTIKSLDPRARSFTFIDYGGGVMEFQGFRGADGTQLGGQEFQDGEFYPGGPTLQELTQTLKEHGSWNDQATVEDTFEPDCHRFTVDIEAVLSAPEPYDGLEASPRTRSLSEDEQDILIEAAFQALPHLEDDVEDAMDADSEARKVLLLESVNRILLKPAPPA